MKLLSQDNILNRINLKGSYKQVAVIRILVGAQILYAVNSKIFPLLLAVKERQPVKTIFPTWFDDFLAANMVEPLIWICIVTSALVMIGLFTRYALPILTVAFILLFGFYYLGANAPIQWIYLWFPLIVLCFSNSSRVYSVDALLSKRSAELLEQSRWPLEMMSFWFVYVYFSAGLAKIFPILKGARWLYGVTSKDIIYNRFLDSPFHYIFGEPFFNYADSSFVFAFLSISALVFELGTALILFTRKYNLWILGLIVSMHFFLYMVGVAGFMQTALILGVALMPANWFEWKLGKSSLK